MPSRDSSLLGTALAAALVVCGVEAYPIGEDGWVLLVIGVGLGIGLGRLGSVVLGDRTITIPAFALIGLAVTIRFVVFAAPALPQILAAATIAGVLSFYWVLHAAD
jgi:hypothetical protein